MQVRPDAAPQRVPTHDEKTEENSVGHDRPYEARDAERERSGPEKDSGKCVNDCSGHDPRQHYTQPQPRQPQLC